VVIYANDQALLLARFELTSKVGPVLCVGCRSGSCWFLNGHVLLVEWLDEEACIIYKIRE